MERPHRTWRTFPSVPQHERLAQHEGLEGYRCLRSRFRWGQRGPIRALRREVHQLPLLAADFDTPKCVAQQATRSNVREVSLTRAGTPKNRRAWGVQIISTISGRPKAFPLHRKIIWRSPALPAWPPAEVESKWTMRDSSPDTRREATDQSAWRTGRRRPGSQTTLLATRFTDHRSRLGPRTYQGLSGVRTRPSRRSL